MQDENETELKVAYLGGSVTVGSGSSDASTKSWRALVGQWFVDNFGPGTTYNKNVTNVHAAIGATGSYFGSYRVWQDCQLGSDNPPDVLFIEFAINDIYDSLTQVQTEINYESIIRQAYKANPKINIIPVFTMDISVAHKWLNTGDEGYVHFAAQRALAEYYGLPQVNVGHALINVINADYIAAGKTLSTSDSSDSGSIWRKYITDSCHPGDAGYAVYAQTVTDYISEQLGDTVSHDADVVSVDLATTPSYASTKGNEAHLKENGRYISFKDAGFTVSDLHGWQPVTTSTASSLANSNGRITTTTRNASFAFKFTGTAVGFFNYGKPTSGTLEYTITSTADPSEVYTGTVSLVKSYNGGLPYPGELKTGLANKEWLVECVMTDVGKGCDGDLRYIYIDGDTSSITPAQAPDTVLPPITVGASAYTEVYGGSIGALTTYEGLPAKPVTSDTSSTKEPQVDYFEYHSISKKIYFPEYKYVGVTYYYDPNGSTVPQNITMELDKLYYNGSPTYWLPGSTKYPMSISQVTKPIISGKWVTQYFDFSAFAEAAATHHPGSYLHQGRHYPFGLISGNTITKGEKSWFNGISFNQVIPTIYNTDGELVDYNDGSAIAYVSTTGSVTVGENTYTAYTSISEAIDALSPVGGKILVSGSVGFTDGSLTRKTITIEGIDENAKLTNSSLTITRGDVVLDNISMVGATDEIWTETRGHTLTLGENFTVDNNVRFGATANCGGKPTNIVMYAGKISDSAAAAGDGHTINVTGDSKIDIYGGKVVNLSGISRNGISTAGMHTVTGDVTYNIYGGNISGALTTTTTTGKINGNLWYNIYGGTFASDAKIGYGDRQGYGSITPSENRCTYVNGNQIIIINNKQIKENGGTIKGVTVGEKINHGIYNANAGKFAIINNAELCADTGAAISASTIADYALLVNGGAAIPVFDENNALKGFEISSDIENAAVYIEDEAVAPTNEGLYVIPAQAGVIRNINIKDASSIDIVYTDGTTSTTVSGKQNGTIVLPTPTFTKSGYAFTGWKTEGDDTLYLPGEEYTLGFTNTTFTAQWIAKTDIKKVYVNPSAASGGTGLDKKSPLKDFKAAQTLVENTAQDFTIVLDGEFTMTGYNSYFNNHTGTITLDGEGTGILSWDSQMYSRGPMNFENIKFRVRASNNFMDASGKKFVFGENISNLPTKDGGTTLYTPSVHLGITNNTTPYQYIDVHSGAFSIIYAGAYYNTSQTEADESKGARVYIDGGSINRVRFLPDGYTGNNGPSKWTGAPSLIIDGGKVSNVETHANSTYAYPVQIVINKGIDTVPAIADNGKAGVILIKSNAEGYVDITETPGVFRIVSDSEKIYINGVPTEKSADNLYTLNTAGTYEIAYNMTEIAFVAGTKGVTGTAPDKIAVTSGSTITLPTDTFAREGFTLTSWYDGTNYYAAGSEVAVSGDEVTFMPIWAAAGGTHAYLSADGYIDTDADGVVDTVAVTTFQAAINSITAAEGGTIYIEGIYNGSFAETTNASRGPVTISGITDDSANKLSLDVYDNYHFTKGDITLDHLTIKAPTDECFISISNGYTMTFGKDLKVESRFCDYTTWKTTRYLYVGSHSTATGISRYVIDGGDFSYLMSGGAYNASTSHTGDVYYTINGGNFREYYAGSRNSSKQNKYTTNGNVYHTINGGTFNSNLFLGSQIADKVIGNVIFTVNGGVFKGKSIIAGHSGGSSDTSLVAGINDVVIVNNANFGEDDNISGTILGRSGAGKNVGGAEYYIINNCEINTGVAIDTGSTAAYKIRVNSGNAKPVFAEGVGGALLGFDIVSDVEGLVPYVGGAEVELNANGYYELTANTTAGSYIDISFAVPKTYVVIGDSKVAMADNYTVTAIDGVVNFAASDVPVKENSLFLGWYYADNTAVAEGATLTAGTVITAKFHDYITDYTDENANFTVIGAQIRLTGDPAFRFVNEFGKALRETLVALDADFAPDEATDTGIGYGFAVLPADMLVGKLTKETTNAATVPAVKTYRDETDSITYTVCITGVTNYVRDYTVVPYITYNDAQGITHTVYGEEYTANMAEIAAIALEREPNLSAESIELLTTIAGK